MSTVPRIAAVAAAVAALAVAGCGGSDEPEGELLPATVSSELLRQLDSVGNRVADGSAGACDDIYLSVEEDGNLEPIDAALDRIPPDVDAEVRAALEQSIDRLKLLVDRECERIRAREGDEPDSGRDIQDAPQTDTTPTETETAPPETEPRTEPPTERPRRDRPQGRGPDGTGPPGQEDDGAGEGGGAEAPEED